MSAQTGFTVSQVVANAATGGTTLNQLACWNGSSPPSAAVNCGTGATTGLIGVVIGNAGTSGSAEIVQYGPALCMFDAVTAPTAGDYITQSTSSAGACRDAGATYPTSAFPVGIVTASGAASSVTPVYLFGISTSPGTYSIATSPISPGTSGAIRINSGIATASSGAANSVP